MIFYKYKMKSSIIFIKNKITVDEILNKYKYNIIWFCILGLNYGLNYYYINNVQNILESQNCVNSVLCTIYSTSLLEKIIISKKIICIAVLVNLIAIIIIHKINICSNENFISYLIFQFYMIITSLFANPHLYPKEYLNFCEDNNMLIITIININYLIFDIIGLFYFLVIILMLITFIFEELCIFYKTYVKDISFEYIQTNNVDIEKGI